VESSLEEGIGTKEYMHYVVKEEKTGIPSMKDCWGKKITPDSGSELFQ
jgi:hypothetical protein